MSKQILIDSYFGLVRTAIAEGASLLDYYEESPDQGRSKGNIYRGVVKKVDEPIQAAFVRFGGGRDGFLPLRDAGLGKKSPKVGDAVLVQVVKDEVGDKGAALTTKLSLSGRYLVFIPARESEGGISSKITDEERAALKKILADLQIPEGGSVILRTAAMHKGIGELQADLDRLTESYREIMDKFSKGKDAALLFREVPPALRYLREYYAPDVERIWVNQEEVLDQCRQFFYLYEPKSAAKVTLSKDGPLMFHKLGLEVDVERLNSRKVGLPSGANIIIDQAEALVAIDVNSAKAGGRGDGRGEEGRKHADGKGGAESGRSNRKRGNDLEETVFAVNKEAAAEIARQLRLRDLGGIIIVDFIDMEEEKHRRQIEEIMRRALASDKAKVKIYDISPLGIMQISRQRLRKAGPNFSRQACEPCLGRGWHPSPAAGALMVLRKMEERLHGKKAGQSLMVSSPYPIANKLINEFREHVFSMEKRFGCTLRITALPTASGDSTLASQGPGGEDLREGREGRDGGRTGQGLGAGRSRRGEPRMGREEPAAEAQRESPDSAGRPADAGAGNSGADTGLAPSSVRGDAGPQEIHPELIRAFDALPSHPLPTPVAAPRGRGRGRPGANAPVRDSARDGLVAQDGNAKAQADAAGPVMDIPAERARETQPVGRGRAPRAGQSRRPPGVKGAEGRRMPVEAKVPRDGSPSGGSPEAPAKTSDLAAKTVETRIKSGAPVSNPAPAANDASAQASHEASGNPRRRSRRRSRRGKGGSKGGAASA